MSHSSQLSESLSASVLPNAEIMKQYVANFNFPFLDETSKYEKPTKIGQGTFGEVYKAQGKNDKFVAMKRILMDNEKEGFPITAIREIRILQLLKHENVINLIEICRKKCSGKNSPQSSLFLVLEFCEHDLAGLLSNSNIKFSLGEIKQVIKQLLNALYFIHFNKIIHRDVKAANILITKAGVLKMADFGLARPIGRQMKGQTNCYTSKVVTLWYRPPELLLGERNYGTPVDMWGAGCIMAEMWTRSPIMQGKTEQQQLLLCTHLCGSITPEIWPGVDNLKLFKRLKLPTNQRRKLREKLLPYVKDLHGIDLIDKLLILNPEKRINADDALIHDFFWKDPMPSDLGKLLSQLTHSNFEYFRYQSDNRDTTRQDRTF